jgi:PPOX class probable FMN-dependent enzyme
LVETLEALYSKAIAASLRKVADHLTPLYQAWIGAGRFCVLSTIGPYGTDGSARGDLGPVVRIQDDKTFLLPDWPGNNRLDSLRNIVKDGFISLMFMVPGADTMVRVNGHASLTADPDLCASFSDNKGSPVCVMVITVQEVYIQCEKSVKRAALWQTRNAPLVPSLGEILNEATDLEAVASS